MFNRLWDRLLRRVFRRWEDSTYQVAHLGDLEGLARSGPAAWLLAQEKARLDYLAARDAFERTAGREAFLCMSERLLELQSTSAIVQALLNEHALEQLLIQDPTPANDISVGKSR